MAKGSEILPKKARLPYSALAYMIVYQAGPLFTESEILWHRSLFRDYDRRKATTNIVQKILWNRPDLF